MQNSLGVGKNGNVSVLVTATPVPFAQFPRESVSLFNLGSAAVYLGFSAAVTTATGYPIPSQSSFSIDSSASMWLISGTAGQDVRFVEGG